MRFGFTLIETLVFISVSSALFLVVAQMMRSGFQLSESATARQQHTADLARLSLDLRNDLRQVQVVRFHSEQHLEVVNSSQQIIQWQILDNHRLCRSVQSRANQEPTAKEEYRLTADSQARLSLVIPQGGPVADDTESLVRRLRLAIVRKSRIVNTPPQLERLIEAPVQTEIVAIVTDAGHSTLQDIDPSPLEQQP
ncbi:MAG: hypothetical protein KF752_10990 [Pirellulaceae bacterium]|nr:hypothetical protein [Pirellulaceae bacterium]